MKKNAYVLLVLIFITLLIPYTSPGKEFTKVQIENQGQFVNLPHYSEKLLHDIICPKGSRLDVPYSTELTALCDLDLNSFDLQNSFSLIKQGKELELIK